MVDMAHIAEAGHTAAWVEGSSSGRTVAYMDCTFAEDIVAADADADADCTASFWTYLAACLALPADDDSSCRLGKISQRCPKRVLYRRASTRALQ
jgi:hypothetical protein